jgi:hypothetical protein
MRRWLIVGAVFALLGASVVSIYLWYRHEDNIEKAVHARLDAQGVDAGWVSCSKDHTVPSGATLVTYYRCDIHGERIDPRVKLKPSASAVCTPFVDGRIATEAEVGRIPLEDVFCEGFG